MTSNVKRPGDEKLAQQAAAIGDDLGCPHKPVGWNAAKASQRRLRDLMHPRPQDPEWDALIQESVDKMRAIFDGTDPMPARIRRHGNGRLAREARERET